MAVTKEQVFEALSDYLWKPVVVTNNGEDSEILFFNLEEAQDKGEALIGDNFGTSTFNPVEIGMGNIVIVGIEAELDEDPEALTNHDLDVIMQADYMYFVDLDASTPDKIAILQADVDGGVIPDSMQVYAEDLSDLEITALETEDEEDE